MLFSEYVNSLPNLKVEEIKKIAELTCSSTISVYNWVAGKTEPPLVKKKIIAEYLGSKHSASCVFFSPLFLPTFVASL